MRSQSVLRNQSAMEQHAAAVVEAAPGAPRRGHGHGHRGGHMPPYGYGYMPYGGYMPYSTSYVLISPPPLSYFVNRRNLGLRTPDEQATAFFSWAQAWWTRNERSIGPTCSSWLSDQPGALPMLTAPGQVVASQESARDWWAHAFLLHSGPESSGWYDHDTQALLLVQAITSYCMRQTSMKAPGSIGLPDRQRMLNSMTPEETTDYTLLSAADQSAFEDRWLTAYPAPPPGTPPSANAYRFAEKDRKSVV